MTAPKDLLSRSLNDLFNHDAINSTKEFGKTLSTLFHRSSKRPNKVNPLLDHDIIKLIKPEIPLKKTNKTVAKQFPSVNDILFRYLDRKLPNFKYRPLSFLPSYNPVDMRIFLKSPYTLAGNELQGTISVKYHNTSSIEEFIHNIKHIKAVFSGTEAIHNAQKTHVQFISLPVLELSQASEVFPFYSSTSSTETKHLAIPFSVSLPSDLSGTFISKKGSIKYQITSHLEYTKHNDQHCSVSSNEPVTIFANLAISDVAKLNSSISCSGTYKSIDIKVNLPRCICVSGEPMFVTAKVRDRSGTNPIYSMKVQIVRCQQMNTSLTSEPSKVTESVISQTTFDNRAMLKLQNPKCNEFVSIMMDIPANAATINTQRLMQMTYSLQVIISCSKNSSSHKLIEIPITIAHAICINSLSKPTKKSVVSCSPQNVEVESSSSPSSTYASSSLSISVMDTPISAKKSLPGLKKSISQFSSRLSRVLSSPSNSSVSPSSTLVDHDNDETKKSIMRVKRVQAKKYRENPACLRDVAFEAAESYTAEMGYL